MTLTAVLFAGGASRRMGVDKATLEIGGEPLWSRQFRLLRALRPSEILVSARSVPAWLPSHARAVLDEPPSRGPLSGLVAALRETKTTHLFALAIDLPRMTAAHAGLLCNLARPGVGVIPRICDRYEPLGAIYSVESLPKAGARMSKEDCSLQSLANCLVEGGLAFRYSPTGQEKEMYLNLNTPDDMRCARL